MGFNLIFEKKKEDFYLFIFSMDKKKRKDDDEIAGEKGDFFFPNGFISFFYKMRF